MAPFDVASRICKRQRRQSERQKTPYPGSLVRVLDDPDDFEAAVDRAIAFERSIMDNVKARVSHYGEMSPQAVVIELRETASANDATSMNGVSSA